MNSISPRSHIIGSAIKVSLANLICLLVGLGSQVVIAWVFGAGSDLDSYLTALVIPTYLQSVLIYGLSFVCIPKFIDEQASGNEENAWNLLGTIIVVIFVFLLGISLLIMLFSKNILYLTAPGLCFEKNYLASQMLKIIIFSVPLQAVSSLSSGIENARGKFFVPAFAPAIGSAVNLLVVLIMSNQLGPIALAWGALSSAFCNAAINFTPILTHGWKKLISPNNPTFLEVIKLSSPIIIFGIVTKITPVFERYFASDLPDGSISYLGYTTKISSMFLTLLGAGIANSIFPEMAKRNNLDGHEGLANIASFGYKLTLVIVLPLITIFSAVRVDLVQLIFERGAFSHVTTLNVASILPFALIVLAFQMLGNITGRIYYVSKDTITGPSVGVISSIAYILLAKVLVALFNYRGLAGAQVAQWFLAFIFSYFFLPKQFRVISIKKFFLFVINSLFAGAITLALRRSISFLPYPVSAFLSVLIGFGFYVLLLVVQGELNSIAPIINKLTRKLKFIFNKLKNVVNIFNFS